MITLFFLPTHWLPLSCLLLCPFSPLSSSPSPFRSKMCVFNLDPAHERNLPCLSFLHTIFLSAVFSWQILPPCCTDVEENGGKSNLVSTANWKESCCQPLKASHTFLLSKLKSHISELHLIVTKMSTLVSTLSYRETRAGWGHDSWTHTVPRHFLETHWPLPGTLASPTRVCPSDFKDCRTEGQVVLLVQPGTRWKLGKCVPVSMWGKGSPNFVHLSFTSVTGPQIEQTTSKAKISLSWFRLLMKLLFLALVLKIHLNSGKMARKNQYSFYWILGHNCLAQSVDSETTCSFIKCCKYPVFIWKDKQN